MPFCAKELNNLVVLEFFSILGSVKRLNVPVPSEFEFFSVLLIIDELVNCELTCFTAVAGLSPSSVCSVIIDLCESFRDIMFFKGTHRTAHRFSFYSSFLELEPVPLMN